MEWIDLETWLGRAPLPLIAVALFGAMWIAAHVAARVRHAREGDAKPDDDDEGYMVSAVLGLLALFMGFTFSLAIDRYDTRRVLVRDEANAIGTAYLRAQLLPEPHRQRTSRVLVDYLDNRITLAKEKPGPRLVELMTVNDALVTDLWAATSAAFDSIKGLDFSSAYLDSINQVTELDASRKIARTARVPAAVFGALMIYMITSAFMLGYVLRRRRGRFAAGALLALFTLAMVLTIDIDRPTSGDINEDQRPMELLRAQIAARDPGAFERWKSPAPQLRP